ncbi:hypothetical protein JSY14_07050 [Brachybacterium sp. EF45031]|nr:hypothetical protein [Brachybacterium sillae]MCS6711792.1 hypothetical protein [Brachybacterium sillae]
MAASETASGTTPGTAHVENVGAFDIRRFIGALIGLFGLLLTLMGLFAHSAADLEKTGGVNANLWAGLAMLAVAVAFEVWARVDPIRIVVQDNDEGAEVPKDIAPVD